VDREVERPKTSIVSDLMQGIEKTVETPTLQIGASDQGD